MYTSGYHEYPCGYLSPLQTIRRIRARVDGKEMKAGIQEFAFERGDAGVFFGMDPVVGFQVRLLNEEGARKGRAEAARLAAQALSMGIAEIVNSLIRPAFDELISKSRHGESYQQALKLVDDIHQQIEGHVRWLGRFLSRERLVVVSAHYLTMFHYPRNSGREHEFLVLALPSEVVQRAVQTIEHLRKNPAADRSQPVEFLLSIVDELLQPLVHEPKRLMHFNFLVDKTLSGIIALIRNLAFREIRQWAGRIPAEDLPIILNHFERVLWVQPTNRQTY